MRPRKSSNHAIARIPQPRDRSSCVSLDLKTAMNAQANLPNTLKHPSAFLPIAMSLLAVGAVLSHIVLVGTGPQADEGTAAHVWQLLMAGQLPIILFFA